MHSQPSRRAFLRASGASLALLAGCSTTGEEPRGTVTATHPSSPTQTPEATAPIPSITASPLETSQPDSASTPLACDDSLTSFPQVYDVVEMDRLGLFELVVTPETVALGEEFTVELRWVDETNGDGPGTGIISKFTIERETDDGWQSIYSMREDDAWNDLGLTRPDDASPPTPWFEWRFVCTQAGLAYDGGPSYAVCEPLEPGHYRFVYWGLTPPEEVESGYETDYAIGGAFEVTQ